MTAKQLPGGNAPDGSQYVVLTDGAGSLQAIAVTLNTSDLEIGAVEIKNATSDDRVSVSAAGALKVDASSVAVPITDNSGSLTVDYVTTGSGTATGALRVELPTNGTGLVNAAQSGTWTVQPGNTANTTAWLVTSTQSATGTFSTVVSANVDTSLLASNASRKGAAFFNESTQILYLGLSATTASTTAYTVQVPAGGFFELPVLKDGGVFTGNIRGIWASANGNLRVTEWT